MEEIIKKLIAIDKNAREKVENAKAKKADVMGEIELKRSKMKKDIDNEFYLRSKQSNEKLNQAFEKEYSPDAVESKKARAIEKLNAVYEENKEKWVQEIFEKVVKN